MENLKTESRKQKYTGFSSGTIPSVLMAAAAWLMGDWAGVAQPTIISTDPSYMAIGVLPEAPLVITFSAAMNTNATTVQLSDRSGDTPVPIPATATWSADAQSVTNTPVAPFPSDALIYYTVSGEDTLGHALQGATSGFFMTGHGGPTIVSADPPTGATNVSPTGRVILQFSAPMNPAETSVQFIDTGAFPLKFLTATATWSADGLWVTNTPTPAFPANTTISWIASGEDTEGRSLEGRTTGIFITSNGGGGAAPVIVSVSPENLATNIAPNTPVIFRFSAAMDTNVTAVQFTDATAPTVLLSVTPTWSADRTWLTNTPSLSFPSGATVIWSAAGQDLAGNALAETIGAFQTSGSGGGTTNSHPAIALLSRGELVEQLETNLFTTGPLEFVALAGTAPSAGVAVVPPLQQATNLLCMNGPADAVEFIESESDPLAFATNFPAGDYQCVIHAADEVSAAAVHLDDGLLPPAPRVLDWQNPPYVALGQPWLLQWTFEGAGAAVDYLRLRIEQNGSVLFATGLPGSPAALNAAANSVVVPATVFANTGVAVVSLTAFRYTGVDTGSIPGMTLYSARHRTTTFELRIVDGTAPPPVLLTTNVAAVSTGEPFWNPLFTTNGVRPMRFELVGGQLPPGLVLDSAGALSGEPTREGTFDATVRVTDLMGRSTTQSLRVVTVPLPPGSVPPRLENVRVAGGFVTFDVVGAAGTDCAIERGTDLASWTTYLTTNAATDSLSVRVPLDSKTAFFRARVAGSSPPLPLPNPLTVAPALDTNFTASAQMDEFGGTLSLTNAAGYVFALNVPPGALDANETITLTDVPQIGGLPLSGGLRAAVDLQPAGLWFQKPARLDITAPGTIDPATLIGFGAQADGSQFALRLAFVTNNTVSLSLWHFSMAGVGNGSSTDAGAQAQNHPPDDPTSATDQDLAAQLAACKADPNCTLDSIKDSLLKTLIQMADQVVIPKLQQAKDNDALIDDALGTWLNWLRQLQLLGLYDGDLFGDQQTTALSSRVRRAGSLAAQALRNAIQKNCDRCMQHDVWKIYRVGELARDAALLGLDYDESFFSCARKCLVFELKIESEITMQSGDGTFTTHTKAKVRLKPQSLGDPNADWLAQLQLFFTGTGAWSVTEVTDANTKCPITDSPTSGRAEAPVVKIHLYKKRTTYVPGLGTVVTDVFDPDLEVCLRANIGAMPGEGRVMNCPKDPPADVADVFGLGFFIFHANEVSTPEPGSLDAGILGGSVFRMKSFVQGSGGADVIFTKSYTQTQPMKDAVATENTLIELRHTPQ